jgi:hypothetical protein
MIAVLGFTQFLKTSRVGSALATRRTRATLQQLSINGEPGGLSDVVWSTEPPVPALAFYPAAGVSSGSDTTLAASAQRVFQAVLVYPRSRTPSGASANSLEGAGVADDGSRSA